MAQASGAVAGASTSAFCNLAAADELCPSKTPL
jgi:hypothetical protein